jgi:hypothetical protein
VYFFLNSADVAIVSRSSALVGIGTGKPERGPTLQRGGAPAGGRDLDLAGLEPPVALAKARPLACCDSQAQVGWDGPRIADREKHGPALPRPGGETTGHGGGSRAGGRTSTTSIASSSAATTLAHAAGPAPGTSARRSRTMPASAAATTPRSGSPTATTQDPAADAPATSTNAKASEPWTATVPPRRSPRSGNSDSSARGTGRSCSPARVTGRTR